MRISRAVWVVIAIPVSLFFLWFATSYSVYTHTTPSNLAVRVFGQSAEHVQHHASWFSFHIALRKAYSVIVFALIGFLLDKALGPSQRRTLRAVIAVAIFSTLIEIAQKLRGSAEGIGENLFDVGCGALGGWIAITAQRALPRFRLTVRQERQEYREQPTQPSPSASPPRFR